MARSDDRFLVRSSSDTTVAGEVWGIKTGDTVYGIAGADGNAERERKTAEDARKKAEAARVSAESARSAAESARAGSEAKRASAEAARASGESTRAAAEAKRAQAESSRAAEERKRAQAESGRASGESKRVAADQARVKSEQARVSAESARASAEAARAKAESGRAAAESSRAQAESARASGEGGRVRAEASRAGAEASRAKAEGTRADAEAKRSRAESGRAAAEGARAAAEAKRAQAEASRADAEDERGSAETARRMEEKARGEAFMRSMSAADSAQMAELGRADAEAARAQAESARADAERKRAQAQAKNDADQALNNERMRKLSPVVLQAGQYDPSARRPTVAGEPNRVYFVPAGGGQASNAYVEWMWVGGAWELVGQSSMEARPISTAQVDAVASGSSPQGASVLSLTGLSYLWARLGGAFAALSHRHAASDIASGTLAVERLPVVPVSKGGTGQASLDSAAKALVEACPAGEVPPTDNEWYLASYADGAGRDNRPIRRRMSALWAYVRKKADAAYQPKGDYAPRAHDHAAGAARVSEKSVPGAEWVRVAEFEFKAKYVRLNEQLVLAGRTSSVLLSVSAYSRDGTRVERASVSAVPLGGDASDVLGRLRAGVVDAGGGRDRFELWFRREQWTTSLNVVPVSVNAEGHRLALRPYGPAAGAGAVAEPSLSRPVAVARVPVPASEVEGLAALVSGLAGRGPRVYVSPDAHPQAAPGGGWGVAASGALAELASRPGGDVVLFSSGLAMTAARGAGGGRVGLSGPVPGCRAAFRCVGYGSGGNGGSIAVRDGGTVAAFAARALSVRVHGLKVGGAALPPVEVSRPGGALRLAPAEFTVPSGGRPDRFAGGCALVLEARGGPDGTSLSTGSSESGLSGVPLWERGERRASIPWSVEGGLLEVEFGPATG